MRKTAFYLVMLSIFAFTACSDDENQNGIPESDNELLRTSAAVDYVNEGDFQISMEAASDNESMRISEVASSMEICAEVGIQTGPNNTFPKTITLNFGTGCTTNGVTRSGILTLTLTGPLLANGSQLTISRTNYYINSYKVEGDVVFVNQTTDISVPQWTRTIANGQITTPAGLVFTHSGTRTVRQIEGVETLPLIDNVFEVVTGNHTVTRQNGTSLTAMITTPLIKKYSCAHISQGVVNLQGEYLDGDLDYGNNECDNTAIYTHSNGQTHTVTLM